MSQCLPSQERRTIAALSATEEPPTEPLSSRARRGERVQGIDRERPWRAEEVPGEGHEAVAAGGDAADAGPRGGSERVARNTAIFSILTAFSRVAGLGREILAASYFGTSGPASAFTLANLVPNLIANLFAQAALSAAFVPVFTDLLQQGRRREAFRLASTLFWIMLIALAAITAFFELAAGVIMPLFTGPTFSAALDTLTVGLSQVLFPVVLLLGLTGLLVGILQSYEHFTIPALAPAVWNIVIIVALVALRHDFHGEDEIYAYADRHRDRHGRAVRDGARGARADRLPPAVLRSTGTTRASARCSS